MQWNYEGGGGYQTAGFIFYTPKKAFDNLSELLTKSFTVFKLGIQIRELDTRNP